jgi:hypothetical protein
LDRDAVGWDDLDETWFDRLEAAVEKRRKRMPDMDQAKKSKH